MKLNLPYIKRRSEENTKKKKTLALREGPQPLTLNPSGYCNHVQSYGGWPFLAPPFAHFFFSFSQPSF